MSNPKSMRLFSNALMGKYVLVNGYELTKSSAHTVEYLYDESIPAFDYIDRKSRKNIKVICLSNGSHVVDYKGSLIRIAVTATTHVHQGDLIKEIVLTSEASSDAAMDTLIEFVNDSKKHVEDVMLRVGRNSEGTIKKYMFDPVEGGHWELLNVSNKRPIESIFLPAGDKSKLVDTIRHFVTDECKNEYAKFNVPYKLNILLYGLPGTGKTSCIHALASEIGSDIGIIYFSRALDDNLFTKALNSVSNLDTCKVIILEDIDCLFSEERKAHDTSRNNVTMSGLLNCLDGLSRSEGTIIFMTTNDRKVLKDAALIRACRVDAEIEFKQATDDQIYDMIAYYFPVQKEKYSREQLIHPFVTCAGCTTSALQSFLFIHRACKDVTLLGKEFKKYLNDDDTHEMASMYM